jgi:hypothetical protein
MDFALEETQNMCMQVPRAAAHFVELEALRWETRKLSDAKVAAEAQARAAAAPWQPAA